MAKGDPLKTPCPACGKLTRTRYRSGKLRYTHKCPHKLRCSQSDPLWGTHYTRPKCGDCLVWAPESRRATWV